MLLSNVQEVVGHVASTVVPLVNSFRTIQDASGRVIGDLNVARDLLERLYFPMRATYIMLDAPTSCLDSFVADVEAWLTRGLDSPPEFNCSLLSYTAPDRDTLTFFIAPLVATNGPLPRGNFLECFLAYREEPIEVDRLIHKYWAEGICSCNLLVGSSGFSIGSCLVFFPENVAAGREVKTQPIALSFSNKFQKIFLTETLPTAKYLFRKQKWHSSNLSSSDYYRAHCIWSYMHDYFHQQGPRPLNLNLQVKMNFFAGLLEETKVDCQVAQEAYNKNIPFGREIVEFILCERLLRYPNQPGATTNFDAGAGLFLFEWLRHHHCGLYETDNGFDLDIDGCMKDLHLLEEEIESIEKTTNDGDYRRSAKDFVRSLLSEGRNGTRFAVPDRYARWIMSAPAINPGSTESVFDIDGRAYRL